MALAEVFEAFAGPDAPVEFRAYDGSHAGAAGSPVKITVRSPAAVAYLAQAPGGLGLARAYVAGHLDVEGDMYETLARMTKAQSIDMSMAEKLRLLQALGGPKLLLHRMPPPPQEVTQTRRWLTGRLHSKTRDAEVISHHYDVSNRFYEWVLGPSMAYTCACLPPPGRDPGRGAGVQVRPGRPQAGAARGHAAARRRLRLGRHGDARGAGVRRQGARGHAVRPAGRLGPGGDRAGGAVRARRGAAPGLPRRAGDRLRRGQLDRADRAHRQGEPAVLLLVPVPAS